MIDKKILRFELFRHIDGIALIAPITAIFKKDTKLHNLLRKKQEFTISNNNDEIESINGDYLNVTLRLFESQGWLKRYLNDKQSINIIPTDEGIDIFNNSSIYSEFFIYFNFLKKLNFYNSDTYIDLNKLLNQFDNLIKRYSNQIVIKHIEGLIIGSTLVSIGMNKILEIDQNKKLFFNKKISNENQKVIKRIFQTFKFIDENGRMTEKGIFFYKRSAAYGVTVSYMPLFSKIETLLFNDTSNILKRDESGNELHVNRKMNVWGSGGAHKLYFKKIDEIVLEIFNRPIGLQPQGLADMGCGDGTLLIHLHDLIVKKTLRGKHLDKYPLHIIGADFNEEALEVTGINLNKNNINHFLVKADIGNPTNFNTELEEKHNIKLNDLLSVRSFLDHNRIFEMPKLDNFDLRKITTKSTAAFCCNENNKIYEPIIFKVSLVEHFVKWKPFISKYGLILLELHTINPNLCRNNIGKTLATAYDATHGYSNQYIIEYEDFIDAARIAGLENDKMFEFNFPKKELTTVSINLFST